MGNIVPGNNKNSEGTGTNGNSGEHSSPPAKDDSNKPKMGARRYSQEREQNKLRCTLKNASKQGDRPINPPKRYTAEDYENTRRSTPRRPNVRRGIAKKVRLYNNYRATSCGVVVFSYSKNHSHSMC
ncbi:hypothetical protein Y032_0011g1547 [Ancylostoma ceylanicum]|uniref:Uncharacterized protein n=1 Tax=Ancylostoma ceylanicum TaxID=53326 RepID=A0A016VH68_9BILA|nr:hypothetical protein Y032_0011g1547 [Ancylostoma ceylanicum]